MFKRFFNYLFSTDTLADEMLESVKLDNNYKTMDNNSLFIQDVTSSDDIKLQKFNLLPNRKNLLIIDDYYGIMRTPEIIINSYDDLNIDDYNIIKFYGIQSGKELLYWLEKNPDIKIDIAIIDMLINGIDGVDILSKLQKTSPDVRYVYYSGVYLDGSEYKYNKARAKYNKFIKGKFLDNIILKSSNFEEIIAPALHKFIKG